MVVFVLCGYAISTVLAFDGSKKPEEAKQTQVANTSASLHTQIESNVAFGVKKVWKNLVEFMQEGLSSEEKQEPTPIPIPESAEKS